MKHIKLFIGTVLAIALASCTYDPYKTDAPAVVETLSLTSSIASFDMNEVTDPGKNLITFEWTPARTLSDEYLVTYTTELDVVGNNFGSNTAITNVEEDGVTSRSFTGEQISNWINDRWALPINKDFKLEFRVVATFTGGPTFEMPEVRKVIVDAKPVKVIIFDADKMSLGGTAISSETEIFKTLENDNQYAWVGDLTPGELQIPVIYEDLPYYICPSGDGTLKDGENDAVTMEETAKSWKITEAGKYRVVVNMADKIVKIYSPKTDLKPKSVTFKPNGTETNPDVTLEVSELYAYGGGTGWGVKTLGVKQSLADPQILVYSGAKLSGGMKFCISKSFSDSNGASYNQNNSYCYTCPLKEDGTQQNASIESGKVSTLHGGSDRNTRNSYMTIPAETNFIVFDLRNMTILATKK